MVRTKTRFAESVLDMRDSTDYHDLPGDASDLIATPGINRFAGIKLVRECGALFKLFAVPPPKPIGVSRCAPCGHGRSPAVSYSVRF